MGKVDPTPPTLFVVCGLPFAGKTTLANALIARFGLRSVDVDETKRRLYGTTVPDDELTPADWVRIYQETDHEIAGDLRSGVSVVDASRYFRKEERDVARQLAQTQQARVVTIFVETPC